MARMPWYSIHTHSKFSAKDALPTPMQVVETAASLGYPAIGLTDHGSMGGIAQGYKAARKHGLEFLPGIEAYVCLDRAVNPKATMHMGLLATSEQGYRNLVELNNMAMRNFYRKPILDLADFAQAAEDGRMSGVAALTGCWFGLVPTLMRGDAPVAVRNVIRAMEGWFGSGVYVEIQNHLIHDKGHDDSLHSMALQAIADSLGTPTVITQDSHYCLEHDRAVHETMKRLVSWSDDPDDAVFPGDGYHMVDTEWMEDHHVPRVFDSGMAGLADLLGKARVRIPEMDTFTAAIPHVTGRTDVSVELLSRCSQALGEHLVDAAIPKSRHKAYRDRLAAEAAVVNGAGFGGYLLFTQRVCEWIASKDILFNIRGSASGSLLCFLLGITRLDPIKWGLPFERFLSTDQTSMPDIDIDVEDTRREEIVQMLEAEYVAYRIGTWATMGLSKDDDTKGSLVVMWKSKARRTGVDPDGLIPDDTMDELRALAAHAPYRGQGVHAAGVVVAPDEKSLSGLPLNWVASSKTMTSAFPMKDVESMGLVKLDILGVKTLTALHSMQETTGIDPFSVPLDDKAVFRMLAKGDVDGVFQLEGYSTAARIRQVKVTKFSDVVHSVALFRPAAMKSGATDAFVARRAGLEKVTERHPVIMRHTKDTAGVMIYQEQAMSIMRDFGLPIEDVEKARKAIKASNRNVWDAEQVMSSVIATVKANATDLSDDDAAWLEDALRAYADYSFNRAHATAYGQVAYITAWFKLHYPVQFWAGQLDAYTGDPQEAVYLMAARKKAVAIRSPHVNRSGIGYVADIKSNAIRKGLTSVKGVGLKAAEDLVSKAPFTSLEDLAERVNARAVTGAGQLRKGHSPEACGGVVKALYEAGALTDLPTTKETT